jgi:hypothetical protein
MLLFAASEASSAGARDTEARLISEVIPAFPSIFIKGSSSPRLSSVEPFLEDDAFSEFVSNEPPLFSPAFGLSLNVLPIVALGGVSTAAAAWGKGNLWP